MISQKIALVKLLFITITVAGCGPLDQLGDAMVSSYNTSLNQISNSVNSMSKSLVRSSGSSTSAQEAYRRDLGEFTALFIESQATSQDFLRETTRIAEQNGITHWQREATSYIAIGQGLKLANVSRADVLVFKKNLDFFAQDEFKYIWQGYTQ